MEYKYKIDVANIEDTETIVKLQLAMAKESEGTELDYETVREGVKAGIADDSKATYLVAQNDNNEVLGSLMLKLLLDSERVCASWKPPSRSLQGVVRLCQGHCSVGGCRGAAPVC